VLVRALERESDRRYQSAADLEAALRQAVDKPRLIWPWFVGGAIILALLASGGLWLNAQSNRMTPTPTITPTIATTPLQAPLVRTPTTTPSVTLSATATAVTSTPTVTPSLTSGSATATRATTRIATPVSKTTAPVLISPRSGSTVNGSRLGLQWQGQLPGSDYGYRASVSYESGEPVYTSPILDIEQWVVELPANRVGAWRWFVEIVRRADTPQVVARSSESIFYHDPFASPLATPAP
jgi:hypothetical protein